MEVRRSLPSLQNPYTEPKTSPPHDELVKARRLGRTDTRIFGGQASAFEYAHLKVRLPENLEGSEVFRSTAGTPVPNAYFLMRRSTDGHVSATGMFRVAFPWATKSQEKAELAYLRKLLPASERDEMAGNFWIDAKSSLDLAADYNLSAWIRALLDPHLVLLTSNANSQGISEPPPFIMPAAKKTSSPDETRSPGKRTVSREIRSTSPSKSSQTPSERPKASPKKRGRKPKKAAVDAEVGDASKSLQDIVNGAPALAVAETADKDEAAAAVAEAVVDELAAPLVAALNGDGDIVPENAARVTVTSNVVEGEDDEEIIQTKVKIDMPLDAQEQALPASPEQMTADAKAIVKDALELQKAKDDEGKKTGSKRGRKRKASEAQAEEGKVVKAILPKSGPEEVIQEIVPAKSDEEPPTKRTRVMVPAEEYQREKMQRRALVGTAVAAGLGVAWTAMPYAFQFASNLGNIF